MATYYVDPIGGNNSNPGTQVAPFATLSHAWGQITGNNETIYLLPGIYYEGELPSKTYTGLKIIGVGDVLINAAGYDYFIGRPANDLSFYNLKITGWETSFYQGFNAYGQFGIFYNCVLYQYGSKYNVARWTGQTGYHQGAVLYGCTFYGILGRNYNNQYGEFKVYNSIIITGEYFKVDSGGGYREYCASNRSEVYNGTGCWNIADYAPPFVSDDTANPDLRFDPSHAQFNKYVTGGRYRAIVGSPGRYCINYQRFDTVKVGDNNIYGNMQNDDSYYDPSFAEIVVSSANNNKNFDFDEGGSEITATIADGTYSDGTSYASAIQAAINASSATDTHTITYSASKRINWASDGTELNLLCATGTNSTEDTYDDMGFDTAVDHTGQTSYTGDFALTVGPGTGAPSDCGPAVVDTDHAYIDLTTEPDATCARVITPVIDLIKEQTLLRAYVTKNIDGNGEIDNSLSDSTREIEVRASSTIFSADDPSGSTDLDWTLLGQDGTEDLDETYRYWQARFVLTLNKTV